MLYYFFTLYVYANEKDTNLNLVDSINEFFYISNLNGHHTNILKLTFSTLYYFFVNFTLASLLGVFIGTALGLNKYTGYISNYYINFFRVMPSIIYIVLFKYQFKFTDNYIYFVGVFASIWPIIINTKSGVEKVNLVQREAIKILNLPFKRRLLSFVLPEAFPNIWDGMKIGLGISFLITITCEYLYPDKLGMGAMLKNYEDNISPLVSMIIILWIGFMGIILNFIFELFETNLLWLRKQFSTYEGD